MNMIFRSSAALVAAALLSACTSNIVSEQQYSGYLDNYEGLEEVSLTNGVGLRWVDSDIDFSRYSKVIIDPVTIYPEPKTGPQVDASVIKQITDYLNTALNKQVSQVLPTTQTAGPSVLRLRAAITSIQVSADDLEGYEYIPIALIVTGGMAAADEHDQMVEVFVEVEVQDSQSGAVVGKAVAKGFGEDLDNDAEKLTLEKAKPVLDDWAENAKVFFQNMKK